MHFEYIIFAGVNRYDSLDAFHTAAVFLYDESSDVFYVLIMYVPRCLHK